MYVERVPEMPCTFHHTSGAHDGNSDHRQQHQDHSDNTEIPETAQKIREQMLSTVKQGQQLSIEAAQGWVKAVSVLPIPDLPNIPGVPAIPTIGAASKFTFDVAADLLNAQRDYTLQLVNVLAPVKSV